MAQSYPNGPKLAQLTVPPVTTTAPAYQSPHSPIHRDHCSSASQPPTTCQSHLPTTALLSGHSRQHRAALGTVLHCRPSSWVSARTWSAPPSAECCRRSPVRAAAAFSASMSRCSLDISCRRPPCAARAGRGRRSDTASMRCREPGRAGRGGGGGTHGSPVTKNACWGSWETAGGGGGAATCR